MPCFFSLWICFLLPASIPSEIFSLHQFVSNGSLFYGRASFLLTRSHLSKSEISYRLYKCNVWNIFHISLGLSEYIRWNLIFNIKCENVSNHLFFFNNTWINSFYLSFSSHPQKTPFFMASAKSYWNKDVSCSGPGPEEIGYPLPLPPPPRELVYIRYLDPLRQNRKIVKRKMFPLNDFVSVNS